jgi:L-ascorbate metabolism protein UlaG (beta-lactamase superfamily)
MGGMMKKIALFSVCWLFLPLVVSASEKPEGDEWLSRTLAEGEAVIWYLGHSGWAIRTQYHFLIFDYWEMDDIDPGLKLADGHVNMREIGDRKIHAFVTHAHSDHWDSRILDWEKEAADITYVFGWKLDPANSHVQFGERREFRDLDGLEIANIHHAFDGIPESAFLVKVDGLTIFHAGDHGHSRGEADATFKDNVDYLADRQKNVDLVFVPTFGGEEYTIRRLKPHAVLPMHDGGNERQYRIFADKIKGKGIRVKVGVARQRGDVFFYSGKRLKPVNGE